MKLNPTGTEYDGAVSGPFIGYVVFLGILAPLMITLQACVLYSYKNKHHAIILKSNKLQPGSFVTRMLH